MVEVTVVLGGIPMMPLSALVCVVAIPCEEVSAFQSDTRASLSSCPPVVSIGLRSITRGGLILSDLLDDRGGMTR
jgi:hypothetical protein